MNPLTVAQLLRLLFWAAVVAVIFGSGVYIEHGRMQKKLDAVTTEYNQFKGGVAALGVDASRRAGLREATDLRNKERVDDENRKRADTDRRTIARLRTDADRARGGFLSQIAAATRRAETAEKLGANFERAYRELVQEVRGVGDDGTKAVGDLDSAKEWADAIDRQR